MKFCIIFEDVEYNVTTNHQQKVRDIIINLRKKYPNTFSCKDFNLQKFPNSKKLDKRQKKINIMWLNNQINTVHL